MVPAAVDESSKFIHCDFRIKIKFLFFHCLLQLSTDQFYFFFAQSRIGIFSDGFTRSKPRKCIFDFSLRMFKAINDCENLWLVPCTITYPINKDSKRNKSEADILVIREPFV